MYVFTEGKLNRQWSLISADGEMHTHTRNSEDTRGEGSTGPYEFRARSWISPGLSLLTEIRGYLHP